MPRLSTTQQIRKLCGCARPKWSACPHPWFVDVRAPKGNPFHPAGTRYRKNLDRLLDYHPTTLTEAGRMARPMIEAWLANRDPHDLHPSQRPTVATVLTKYLERPDAGVRQREHFKPITTTVVHGQPFGDYPLAAVTPALLEAFQAERPTVAGNRNLGVLRSMCRWAVRKGLLETTPFRVGNVVAVSLRVELPRTRRLQGDEADRLLAASRGLSALVLAALETGCRRGELLTLQWSQVRFSPRAELFLPAEKTKARKDRRVPISSVLRPVLEPRRLDPAGALLPPDAYVFGDGVGRRRFSIKTAWGATCRRAGITGLHFHDLRREAGSRWLDAGISLGTIQRWLGHSNIAQTSTYLGASLGADDLDMQRYEQRVGRTSEPTPVAPPVPAAPDAPAAALPALVVTPGDTDPDVVVH